MWNSGAGTKTVNDPCPDGFRVPTQGDWSTIMGGSSWSGASKQIMDGQYTWIMIADGVNSSSGWSSGSDTGGLVLVKGTKTNYNVEDATDAANTVFFMPAAGYRLHSLGFFQDLGVYGYYWSGTPNGENGSANFLSLRGGYVEQYPNYRALGMSVRCIEE
jgi:uncharacterized protein (TIGR02145 family)